MVRYSLDSVASLVAPHECLSCGKEGEVLCGRCIEEYCEAPLPHCAGCRKQQDDFKVCKNCKSWLALKYVYVATAYEGIGSELVKAMKFNYRRQASEPIAKIMSGALESLDENTILCPIPTAHARIRERGFDHAKLISQNLSQILKIKSLPVLHRHTNRRQLGSSRKARFKQMESEFEVIHASFIRDKNILLVDDVMTTGATLTAAAKALRKAGASSVSAIIFTQKL